MRKGYKVTLGILTILILVTITVGTSYSFYSVSSAQSTPNTFSSTCFKVSYTNDSSSINLNTPGNYAYPKSDTKGNDGTPYRFTIRNTCTADNAKVDTQYVVTLNTLTANAATGLDPAHIRYSLNKGTPATVNAIPYTLNSSVKTENGIANSYKLVSGTLAPGASVTYDLRLWIAEDACAGGDVSNNDCKTKIMDKTFEGMVLVYSYM